MSGFRLIASIAAAGVLAGCADQPATQAPQTTSSSPAALPQQTTTPAPTRAARAATTWAAAYCAWSYREPNGQREATARTLMTASAGAGLAATPQTTWKTDVIATQQVATCAHVATHVLEGPQTSTTVYLLITSDRSVTDRAGSVATSQFIEPRRMVLMDGRWLVDARVEGG